MCVFRFSDVTSGERKGLGKINFKRTKVRENTLSFNSFQTLSTTTLTSLCILEMSKSELCCFSSAITFSLFSSPNGVWAKIVPAFTKEPIIFEKKINFTEKWMNYLNKIFPWNQSYLFTYWGSSPLCFIGIDQGLQTLRTAKTSSNSQKYQVPKIPHCISKNVLYINWRRKYFIFTEKTEKTCPCLFTSFSSKLPYCDEGITSQSRLIFFKLIP